MKFVIAPDSFKESLGAHRVADEIERGFKRVFPNAQYVKIPMADGGEGTVESMVSATGGTIRQVTVTAPLGNRVKAHYGILGSGTTAIIEMASASGLHHVPLSRRDPRVTTSYGTGELIKDALEFGVKHIIIGLGGSATNDGGVGMAKALGVKFYNDNNQELADGGASLSTLTHIDISNIHPLIKHCRFEAACDVESPLCGDMGASAIFGPQKGATPKMVTELDHALSHLATVLTQAGYEKKDTVAGVGAAGGMGFGVMTFLNGTLKPGIELVIEALELAHHLVNADLVITGEGQLDRQTAFGKTPIGVARLARVHKVPVIAIAGSLSENANFLLDHGLDAIFSITPRAMSLNDALKQATDNIYTKSHNLATIYALGRNSYQEDP